MTPTVEFAPGGQAAKSAIAASIDLFDLDVNYQSIDIAAVDSDVTLVERRLLYALCTYGRAADAVPLFHSSR